MNSNGCRCHDEIIKITFDAKHKEIFAHPRSNVFLLNQGLVKTWIAAMVWLVCCAGPWSVLPGQTALSIRELTNEGCFWIEFSTEPAWTYHLELSTNLISWQSLVINIPGNGRDCLLADSEPVGGQAQRFYRVGQYYGLSPGEPQGNPDRSQWTWISPGTFTQGSVVNTLGGESDETPTLTTLTKGFWMSRHEVTQLEFLAVMGTNPSSFTNDMNQPVECVSWSDASSYCALLTTREQQSGRLPNGFVYRLPTEAEWEYCCRAGSSTSFSWGNDPSQLVHYAWYWDNSGSTNSPNGYTYYFNGKYFTTQPVGTRQPNPWGLYDMYGNVWEWCRDWHGAYPTGTVTDPTGPASGTFRVIRGGSWNCSALSCRSANRSAGTPEVHSSGIGFRTVLAQEP
jgi:formylglycine-generating enzyme required for sulfatase activity